MCVFVQIPLKEKWEKRWTRVDMATKSVASFFFF